MVPFLILRWRFKMRDALIRLEPPIEALGFELVDVEVAGRARGVLRIYDRRAEDSAAGVTVDDCASVSHV